MVKRIITLITVILLLAVGIAAVCVGSREADQTLLYAGITLAAVALLLSCIIVKRGK